VAIGSANVTGQLADDLSASMHDPKHHHGAVVQVVPIDDDEWRDDTRSDAGTNSRARLTPGRMKLAPIKVRSETGQELSRGPQACLGVQIVEKFGLCLGR
jgi:hypothetical protein